MTTPSRGRATTNRATFEEYDPPVGLDHVIARCWQMVRPPSSAGYVHCVIPDGCLNLIVSHRADGSLPHMTLLGTRLEAIEIPVGPGDQFWGVRFWPDVGAALLAMDATAIRNRMMPAAQLLGELCQDYALQIAHAASRSELCSHWARLVRSVLKPPHIDADVRAVILAIVAAGGAAPVRELSSLVHVSERQLQRRFRAAVGLSMKQYSRLRRLRSSVMHVVEERQMTWSRVAAEFGFADQAHLVRDFVLLTGAAPSDLALRLRELHLANIRP